MNEPKKNKLEAVIAGPAPTSEEAAVAQAVEEAKGNFIKARAAAEEAEETYRREDESAGERVLAGASPEKMATRLRTLQGAADLARRAVAAAEAVLAEAEKGLGQREAQAGRYDLAAQELEAVHAAQVAEVEALRARQLERDGSVTYTVEVRTPPQISSWRIYAAQVRSQGRKFGKGRDTEPEVHYTTYI